MADLEVFDKYSESLLQTIPLVDNSSLDEILEKAEAGFLLLKKSTCAARSTWLLNLEKQIEENAESLAALICSEAGKPISYARGEVTRSIKTLNLAAKEAARFDEPYRVELGEGVPKKAHSNLFPVGPVFGIAPFNFPLNLILHKLGPALAVGNPVIIKPSPYTPLVALELEKLARKAGIPEEVFQVVVCSNETSEKILLDKRIKVFSFTGSPQVGWMLKEKVPRKKVILELGGNAAVVVEDAADLKAVADQVAIGAYLYAGQICISTQRIYVQENIYSEFLEHLLKSIEALKIGDPKEEETSVGPLIDKAHFERISSWVSEAVSSGAEVLTGAKASDSAHNIYAPTLLTNTKAEMKVVEEEVFGPVAIIEKYKNFSEALTEVNNSKFGLQAGVYTDKKENAAEAFEKLEVGGVMINNIPGFRIDSMPYGGVKESGFGREGIAYAMHEMTELKLLVY